MDPMLVFAKPNAWETVKDIAPGLADTLPTTTPTTKPAGAIDLAPTGGRRGAVGIMYFVDFDADGGSADIDWYGGLIDSLEIVHVQHDAVVDNNDMDTVFRSSLKTVDFAGLGWIMGYATNYGGGAAAVGIKAARI